MLAIFTFLVMCMVAYVYLVEGLFTACMMFINVCAAGLVAFEFWEPLADELQSSLDGSFLAGYEDAICLVSLFAITLGLLRLITNNLVRNEIDFPVNLNRAAGAVFGAMTGYLVSGFLICVFQTMPFHENFMFFDAYHDPSKGGIRRVLPPDRVWLALMYRAGLYAFANNDDQTFDPNGTFEIRYARYRRYTDVHDPMPYDGEFERELHRGP